MKQFGFAFDQNKCIGCRTCQMACKDYKDTPIKVNFRRVFEYEGGDWQEHEDGTYSANIYSGYVSMACNHCSDPACLKVCPAKAISKSAENGIVEIDSNKCIACKSCAMVCPYGVPQFNEEKNYMSKCNACRERLEKDMKPICVEACPTRALHYGDIGELREKFGDLADVAPLADPKITKPNITVIASKETRNRNEKGLKVTAPNAQAEVQKI